MRKRKSKAKEMLEILEQGGVYKVKELQIELGLDERKVREIIASLRKQYRNGSKVVPYIYSTGEGYSVDEKPAYVVHESGARLKMATGIMVNGAHVFSRCKQIAGPQFNKMKLEFSPKLVKIAHLS